jgi:hypothetical protein
VSIGPGDSSRVAIPRLASSSASRNESWQRPLHRAHDAERVHLELRAQRVEVELLDPRREAEVDPGVGDHDVERAAGQAVAQPDRGVVAGDVDVGEDRQVERLELRSRPAAGRDDLLAARGQCLAQGEPEPPCRSGHEGRHRGSITSGCEDRSIIP